DRVAVTAADAHTLERIDERPGRARLRARDQRSGACRVHAGARERQLHLLGGLEACALDRERSEGARRSVGCEAADSAAPATARQRASPTSAVVNLRSLMSPLLPPRRKTCARGARFTASSQRRGTR